MRANYSYSSLETYRSCPKKFKFAYIDKASKDTRVNAITYLGNAVHRSLQKLYTLGNDSVLIPKDDIVKFYQEEWDKLPVENIKLDFDYYTIDDYIRLGREMLERYYDKFQPFKEGILLGAEQSYLFTLPGTNYKFRCTVDKLVKHDDGTIEISDYKTGQHITRLTDPRFLLQMGLYQLAVMDANPQYKNMKLTQYFLRKDETVSYQMNSDELEQLTETYRQAVLETITAEKMDNFPPLEGNHCQFCEYYDLCPLKKHQQMLEENKQEKLDDNSLAAKAKELADRYVEVDSKSKDYKHQLDSLKAELTELSAEYELDAFEGETGTVKVKTTREEKFITKTEDKNGFVELSILCRELGLEDYFKLDGPALMKEAVRKGLLADGDLDKLAKFVKEKESSRFTVKRKHQKNDE